MIVTDLFVCSSCKCVDSFELTAPDERFLCGYCDPYKDWHGFFCRDSYDPETDLVLNPPIEPSSQT